MKAYGGSYAEEFKFYHPLVEKMQKAMQDKNAELDSAKKENRRLDDSLQGARESKDGADEDA